MLSWRIIGLMWVLFTLMGWMGSSYGADTGRTEHLAVASQHHVPVTAVLHHQKDAVKMASYRHRSCNHGMCPFLGCCTVAYHYNLGGVEPRQSARPTSSFATATEFISPAEIRPPIFLL